MDKALDKKLYKKVYDEAKQKYKRFPSLYASAWIQKEYQRRGGKYSGIKTHTEGIRQWFDEKWVQVQPYVSTGKKIPCGQNDNNKACRPLKKVNSDTPITMSEVLQKHGKKRVLELAAIKRKDMDKRINWVKGSVS